jgi:hypothetical protein
MKHDAWVEDYAEIYRGFIIVHHDDVPLTDAEDVAFSDWLVLSPDERIVHGDFPDAEVAKRFVDSLFLL